MELHSDRRRSERKVTNISVNYRIGNTQITSYTYDLSRSGMFLETEFLVDEEDIFPLTFSLSNNKTPFTGFGRVVYQHKYKDEPRQIKSRGMGMELLGSSGKDEDLITRYLSNIPSVKSPDKLEATKVMTRRELGQFIELPFSLYRDNPYWIPPLKKEMQTILTEENPFLKHGEMDLFLVKDQGRVVGRIGAIIDHDFISLYKEKVGYFGFFECIPDLNVAKKLFETANHNLMAKGMEKIRGPLSPSLNDEICFLAEGFDSSPNIMLPYNPLYYNNFARGYGMYKVKDFLSFWVNLQKDLPENLITIVKNTEEKGVVLRKFDMKNFSRDVEILRQLNNQSWLEAGHWGFVPITAEEMNFIAEHFRKLADPDIIYIAEVSGKLAGYVLNIPNFFPGMKYLSGKMSPLGILRFLYYLRHLRNVRLLTFGVVKEFCGMNLGAALLVKSILEMQKKGYDSMEYAWVLEDNYASIAIASKLGGRKFKKYRMYEYPLLHKS